MNAKSNFTITGAAVLSLAVLGSAAQAHFPWLATDDQGRALLFFGESPHDREYKLPPAVAEAKVLAPQSGDKPRDVNLEKVEEDGFVGRRSAEAIAEGSPLETTVRYGIYHGMLLDYYTKGLTAVDPAEWEETAKSEALKLNATPRLKGEKLELFVQLEGKPLAGAAATMIDADGSPTEAETNAEGVASFETPKAGIVGFLVNHTDKSTGKFEDEEYTSAGKYATVTVMLNKEAAAASPAGKTAALPSLPEPVASFGGAVCDGWLYLYGGHIGTEHDHSRENLSNHFRRVNLAGGEWQELPMQTPLQGLPLVAHGGKLYRVGGLNARNASTEEDDLHSVAEFSCYDPAAGEWTEMPALPEARSSHDAAVVGDVVYVVGGWKLAGEKSGEWLPTAWSYDLTKGSQGQWQAVTSPPFKRRALAVAGSNNRLVALGGMDDEAKVSRRVDVLDLQTNQWSQLPDLPGKRLGGFGVSAWSLADDLYISGADGVVCRLAKDRSSWEPVGKLERPRFFHRLLPADAATLLAVAGASFSDGHLADIERFAPQGAN